MTAIVIATGTTPCVIGIGIATTARQAGGATAITTIAACIMDGSMVDITAGTRTTTGTGATMIGTTGTVGIATTIVTSAL